MVGFYEIFDYETFSKYEKNEMNEIEKVKFILDLTKKESEKKIWIQSAFQAFLKMMAEQIRLIHLNEEEEKALIRDLARAMVVNCFRTVHMTDMKQNKEGFISLEEKFSDYEPAVYSAILAARTYINDNFEIAYKKVQQDAEMKGSLDSEVIEYVDLIIKRYMNWMKYILNGEDLFDWLVMLNLELHRQNLFEKNKTEFDELVEYYDEYCFDDCIPRFESLLLKLNLKIAKIPIDDLLKEIYFCKKHLIPFKRDSYMYVNGKK